MKNTKTWLLLIAAFALILSACSPDAVELPQTGADTPALPGEVEIPVAAVRAAEDLAVNLGIATDQVQIVSVDEVEWSNACLELPQPGEACAEVLVPGYRVVLNVNGEEQVYHTDQLGDVLRAAGESIKQ